MRLNSYFSVLVIGLLAAGATTGVAAVGGIDTLSGSLGQVVHEDTPRLLSITNVRRLIRSMVVSERDHILEKDAAKMEAVTKKTRSTRADLADELARSRELVRPEDAGELASLADAVTRWEALDDQVIALSAKGQKDEALALAGTHAKDPVNWETVIKGLVDGDEAALNERSAAALEATASARNVVRNVSVGALIGGAALGFFIWRRIKANVEEVVQLNGSLERRVAERTAALAEREASLRLTLDSAGDGMLLVDRTGKVQLGHTRILESWFGAPTVGETVWGYFDRSGAQGTGMLQAAYEQLFDDILPIEVALDVLPQRFHLSGRAYEVEYRPVPDLAAPTGLLLVLRDITERLRADERAREAREIQAAVAAILRDKAGFRTFVKEGSQIVAALEPSLPAVLQMRLLHTLKGNCLVLGLEATGAHIHRVETTLVEGEPLTAELAAGIAARWKGLLTGVEEFVGQGTYDGILIGGDDWHSLRSSLRERRDHEDILQMVELWRREPAAVALGRLAVQARRVGQSLERPVRVLVNDGGVRLPPGVYDSLFSNLVHVVRNAVYHGIGSPEARAAAGKPAEGLVEVRTVATEDGGFILSIEDDGCGIDWARVAEVAAERGLPTEGQEALVDAIFSDGVSTEREANDVAGRGAGLSAVKDAVEKLGGVIRVTSSPVQGTTFSFVLPGVEEVREAA